MAGVLSRPVWAGVVAGAAGLGTAQAVAWAVNGATSPVVAVAGTVRDLTPGGLANFLVHAVKHLDKPLLVSGTVLGVLVLGGVAGWLARFHRLLPDLVFLVLAALGVGALAQQGAATEASVIALLVGLGTMAVVRRFLGDLPGVRVPAAGAASVAGPGRRAFVLNSLAVLVASGLVAAGGRALGGGHRAVEEARRLLRLPVRRGRVPAGADVGVPGIVPWRTSGAGFYVVATALSPPAIRPSDWQLRIHGTVDRPVTVSYEELVGRELVEDWVTLCCVSNEVGGDLIGNAFWSGVPVRELLAEAGVRPGADAVKQTSADGWTCGTPLAALTDPHRNALLAIAMNGRPLPIEHGFPVRMVVPGLYGYVSATKWLVDLEVTRFDRFTAYWTERGWSEKGPVKTESRIDVPRPGATVPAGRIRVGGIAWAQHTGIERVEFQVDGGPWQRASLGRVPSVDTWVQWAGTASLRPGSHRVVVRATDRSGYTQTSARAGVVPDGATGWDAVEFTAS
ncbi:MAG TPA: molybdopterin-dependent oxidoreductase [Motilibacteraceae bacterium]|nr:molybdopterin-dependent oxidoreductase [Motilibacteraceae bacterium]